MSTEVVTSAWVAAGVVVALPGLYLFALALAAFRYQPQPPGDPSTRLCVLIPAHDEEALIGRCVASLRSQRYPAGLAEIVVIADNCADDTEQCAASAGARVLARDDPDARGKGRALAWGFERVLRTSTPPDAVVVVDADTVAAPDFLRTLVAPFEAGAPVVQGESLLAADGTQRTALRAAAFLLINRIRPAGRAVLGLPCSLCGNGMLLARDVLVTHPWQAFSSTEDVEYALALRRAGIGPAFAGGAILTSDSAPSPAAQRRQQLRWEGGKAHLARTWGPRLVMQSFRERRPLLLDAAFELLLPPLGLLSAFATSGLMVTAGLALGQVLPPASGIPWAVAVASIMGFVLCGLRAAGASESEYRAMLRAPVFVLDKVLHAHRLVAYDSASWVRTDRADSADIPD